MFTLSMLPAEYGDCLWLEYGDGSSARRVLIDGGTRGTFATLADRLESLPTEGRHFELFVVTHVDADHIGGALELLKRREALGVTFGDVWFNGYVHLDPSSDDILGPVQGERLTEQLAMQAQRWNRAFRGRSVVAREGRKLPTRTLPGGLRLTVVSPTWTELERLQPEWEKVVRAAGLEPGRPALQPRPGGGDDVLGDEDSDEEIDVKALASAPFQPDRTEANGSSIALIAEYEGVAILLCGDAHAPVLTKTLPLVPQSERDRIRWCKLPHHGSQRNVSVDLVNALAECEGFLVSTNGGGTHKTRPFKHPDKAAIARVIEGATNRRLYFNYRTEYNEVWDDPVLKRKHRYKTRYPKPSESGVTIDLLAAQ